ncbi:hypothetical protein K458DRAFT_488947 [Lentithecium fluviatile CBS 122367]|uniref:Protein kinase domain-containing protein n=1 Tax=Lentithecium fluviatile CBS 122367 TaxID=1168545 RepID=A0A6G1IW18_9PLEO|nr:hypothetical protein K458DRAFT_488947 [Lentithecium fluviatile CBS 122367]
MPIPPLDILSAEADILNNVTSLVALLGYIVNTVREVRGFRKDCQDLTNTCIALSLTFLDNKKALEDTKLKGEFDTCLREVYSLVMQCREWNIAHITLDLTLKHKFSSMKARLDNVRKAFELEILMTLKGASSEAADALRSLGAEMNEMRDAQEEDEKDRKAMFEKLRQLQLDVSESNRNILSLKPLPMTNMSIVSIFDPDICVSEESPDGKPVKGTFKGSQFSFHEIIDQKGTSDSLPRVVKLYRDMTEVAQIQKLYGIVEKDGYLYAAMEDMTQYIGLGDALETGHITQLSRLQKMQIGYEIAATTAALHRAEVLVKVLSDITTHFEVLSDGSARAKLSGLRHARKIWETTTRDVQDPRFEAPETEKAKTRSPMSDVWANRRLGTVLHALFLAELPFGKKADQAKPDNKTVRREIKHLIHSKKGPFDNYPVPMPREVEVARECLRSDPFLRPPASRVAQQLFDILISVAANDNPALPVPTHLHRVSSYLDKSSIDRLVKQISCAAREAKNGKEVTQKFAQVEMDKLKRAAEEPNPVYAYTVGLAYLRDLVDLGNDGQPVPDLVPDDVRRSKLALPYLDMAQQQGHIGAVKELVVAHKHLAKHYYAMLEIDYEDRDR